MWVTLVVGFVLFGVERIVLAVVWLLWVSLVVGGGLCSSVLCMCVVG